MGTAKIACSRKNRERALNQVGDNQCVLLQEKEVIQNSNKTLKPVTKMLQHIAISKNNIMPCFAPLEVH